MGSTPAPSAVPRQGAVSLDIVIPVFNEEAVLERLLARLREVFSPEACRSHGIRSVRYLFVDDGSTDGSAPLLSKSIAAGTPGMLLRLSRNFGHQHAVSAGLDHATADVVAILDADLQDPPELIPAMLGRWREGYEVVYGQRRRRTGNVIRRAGYWLFYRLLSFLAEVAIPLDSGDFCLIGRTVVDAMRALPERLRFPRVLRAWVGFPQAGVPFDRPPREAGRTKYTLSRLYRLATDGVVSASLRPLQLAQVFSVAYLMATLVTGCWYLLWPGRSTAPPIVGVGLFLILLGNFVQVFCIYILGAYVGRTYIEAKGRPPYIIMEIVSRPDA
jgi:glycosyltransferase involved in cell wall biosynthesis